MDSLFPCITTAGDAALRVCCVGTTRTPTLSSGTVCPSEIVSVASPVVALIDSATCASLARRPRLMKLCDALSRTSTS
eukprot:4054220-Pleurochrysis_carterae.AAC.2